MSSLVFCGKREMNTARLRGPHACKLFHPYRGLTLEIDVSSKAEKRCGGVEKPSHGGSREGSNLLVHQFKRAPVT